MSIQCQEMSFSYFDKALVLDFFDLAGIRNEVSGECVLAPDGHAHTCLPHAAFTVAVTSHLAI